MGMNIGKADYRHCASRDLKWTMGQAKLQTLEATAYHEAGHAVAAFQLRVGIGRRGVSIVPNEDWSGFAHTLKGFSGRPDIERTGQMRLGAEKRAIVSFAGEAAQRRFRPMSVRRHHGAIDRGHAIDLMNYFVGSAGTGSVSRIASHSRRGFRGKPFQLEKD
jgi:hypothetical protein